MEISWIKAHVGIHGNEEAGRTAKRAALNEDVQQDPIKWPANFNIKAEENGKMNGNSAQTVVKQTASSPE